MITDENTVSSGNDEETASLFWNAIANGATLKDIHAISDNVMEGIYAHAYQFYQSGRLDDAELFFRFLCRYDTYNPEYLMGLAATLQQRKQYKGAIDAYAFMFLMAKNDYRPVLHSGQCYLFMKQTEQARESFTLILESDAPASIKAQAQAYLGAMKPAVKIESSEASND